jgi:nucleotide-binding universal stress UspA family protein
MQTGATQKNSVLSLRIDAVGFSHVLHPADFTVGDEPAFHHALKIALESKGQLQLLHICEPRDEVRWSDFPHIRNVLARWKRLPEIASHEDVRRLGLEVMKVHRTGKNSVVRITDFISEHHPELVVLGTHQPQGIDRLLHDSKAEQITRKSMALTLFVPRSGTGFVQENSGEAKLQNILIPVDRAPNPQFAIEAATRLARTLRCMQTHFILLYVGRSEDTPQVNIRLEPGWTSEVRSWQGGVVDHILKAAEADEADLIVMGTRGHHGFMDALRGSTTEQVLRYAKCPALAVPGL